MDQTKHKPVRTRDFRFSAGNCCLHLNIFFSKWLQEIEHYFVHQIFKY